LTFHLKRFEHKTDAARKVDDKVRFPTTLNMLPYTAIGLGASEKENPKGGSAASVLSHMPRDKSPVLTKK
jgi:ubiquitin carboxyl-terminal hydrolase 22/27/51